MVRPSGTEPKMKVYVSVSAEDMEEASCVERRMQENMKGIFE